ncbi:MAG: hypothetical protein NZM26_03130 [Patescibacteria group bacterium]|nr:hypothetical protein [Patescibacteria group bacterium]
MKTVVLHGENTLASFERLSKFIDIAVQRGWEIVRINKAGTSLSQALRSQSLFNNNKLFVVEDIRFLSKKDYDYLKRTDIDANLVIYSDKVLTKNQILSFPKNTKFESFTIPKKIWMFLESIYPKNAKSCLRLFQHVCKNEAPAEMLLALMARQMRDVYLYKMGMGNLPNWKAAKIISQARKFEDSEIILQILDELAKIDIKVKTSNADLEDELAFLLVQKLQ